MIRIGPIYFKVDDIHNLFDGNKKLDGRINYTTATIQLDAEMCPQTRNQTLLHEIVHGVATQLGFPALDEDLVDRIAYAAYQVIRDNPEFIKQLLHKERAK
jgi:hypothetical protein